MYATRPTPLGCTVLLIGLLIPFLTTIGLGYVLYRWLMLPETQRPEGVLGTAVGGIILSLILTVLLMRLGIRILRNTDWKNYDSDNPNSRM